MKIIIFCFINLALLYITAANGSDESVVKKRLVPFQVEDSSVLEEHLRETRSPRGYSRTSKNGKIRVRYSADGKKRLVQQEEVEVYLPVSSEEEPVESISSSSEERGRGHRREQQSQRRGRGRNHGKKMWG